MKTSRNNFRQHPNLVGRVTPCAPLLSFAAGRGLPALPKTQNSKLFFILSILFFVSIWSNQAQPAPTGGASNFTSVEYYPAPNQTRIKSQLSGAEAEPLAGGLLEIKQLKLEAFGADGKAEYIVAAPDCVYDTVNGTANSSGHLQLASGDGKIRVEGDGFLWRRNDSLLTISNRVQTVIETASIK